MAFTFSPNISIGTSSPNASIGDPFQQGFPIKTSGMTSFFVVVDAEILSESRGEKIHAGALLVSV